MTCSSKLMVLAAAFVLTAGDSTAKSAHLIQQQAPRTTHGWVLSVQHGKGQATFRIRTAAGNNNFGAAVNLVGVAAAPSVQKFTVGPGTQFDAVHGVNRMPASFASLRAGQRIAVRAQGQQAIGVRIFASNQFAGPVRQGRYIGPRHALRIPGGNQATQGLAATPRTAHTSRPIAVSVNRNVRTVPVARAVAHVMSKKR
jgi:hypothetical protein